MSLEWYHMHDIFPEDHNGLVKTMLMNECMTYTIEPFCRN